MTILVVDDERAVRESLRRALELEGYDIELAGDGQEALSLLAADAQPDAVILDLLMPGVDGLEVCRRLRRNGSRLPVLMLTARDEVENRVAGLDAGADDYVTKPFALEELLARLRALLRRAANGSGEVMRFADLELDPGTRAVALAVIVASAVVFVVVRNQLRAQVDSTLRAREAEIFNGPLPPHVQAGYLDIPGPPIGEATFVQAVTADGRVYRPRGQPGSLPVSHEAVEAARAGGGEHFSDLRVGGHEKRVLTIGGSGIALQIARDFGEVNHTLHRITLLLILIAIGGILVAAALGLAVSRTALGPVRGLTEATEHVTETGDLSQRIEAGGEDELGRLASSFNTMLAALEESSRAQRQLVADASHELRTPLTSLRTNIEVLAGERTLPPEERERLLDDVVEQVGEMTALIAELIELARESRPDVVAEPTTDVRLDLLAADAVERTRRNRPGVEFDTDLHESLVQGAPSTIERAVANLLDNAAKWSPPGATVEVVVRDGEVAVRDHGPGIDDEDLPYVFDRFYRSTAARGMPGSGLGLAIVKQVAEAYGGTVVAERPEGGGTLMRLRLNGRPDNAADS